MITFDDVNNDNIWKAITLNCNVVPNWPVLASVVVLLLTCLNEYITLKRQLCSIKFSLFQEPTLFVIHFVTKGRDDAGPKGVLKRWEFLMISKYNNNCILNGSFEGNEWNLGQLCWQIGSNKPGWDVWYFRD